MHKNPGTNLFWKFTDYVNISLTNEGGFAILASCIGDPNVVALETGIYSLGCQMIREDITSGNNIYYMTGTIQAPAWTLFDASAGGAPDGPTGAIQINNGGSFFGTGENTISPTTGYTSLNASFVAMSDVTYTQAVGSTGSSGDVSQTGGYNGPAGAVYTVTITSTGTGASFSWTCSTGGSGTLVFTGDSQLLNNGFSVEGNNGGTDYPMQTPNYFVGDTFSWTADNMTASQNTGALFIPGPDVTINGSINSLYDSTAQSIALSGVGTIGQIGLPGSIGQIAIVGSNISGTGSVGIQQMTLNGGQVVWGVGMQDQATGAGSNIGVSPTSVVLNTQDALGNQAGVNFVGGGNTFFTNQAGSLVAWDDQNNNTYMELQVGTNPAFTVGDIPGNSNSTTFKLNDSNRQILANGYTTNLGTVSTPAYTGSGINDLSTGGTYSGSGTTNFTVNITGLANATQMSFMVVSGSNPSVGDVWADGMQSGFVQYFDGGTNVYLSDLTSTPFMVGDTVTSTNGAVYTLTSVGMYEDAFTYTDGTNTITKYPVGFGADFVGVQISFGIVIGHALDDQWTFTGSYNLIQGGQMLDLDGDNGEFRIGDLDTIGYGGVLDIHDANNSILLGFSKGNASYIGVDNNADQITFGSNNYNYRFPSYNAVGFISNDGSGNLSWQPGSGGGTVYPANQIVFGDGTTPGGVTSPNFEWDDSNIRLTLQDAFVAGAQIFDVQYNSGNPVMTFGSVGLGNSTQLQINDVASTITATSNSGFTYQNIDGYRFIYAASGGLPDVSIGDIDNWDNGIFLTVSDTTDSYIFNRLNFNIGSVVYQFPGTQGATNTQLTNDGSGTLSWQIAGLPVVSQSGYGSSLSFGAVQDNVHLAMGNSGSSGTTTIDITNLLQGSVVRVSDFFGAAPSNPINVTTSSGLINDPVSGSSSTYTLSLSYGSVTMQNIDGTNWMVI